MQARQILIRIGPILGLFFGEICCTDRYERPQPQHPDLDEANAAVRFDSPCEAEGISGSYRVGVKTEHVAAPPRIASNHHLIPSQIARWAGPGGDINDSTPRSGRELETFEVTGRVVYIRAESDGDLHIQLQDPRGGPANCVVEVPLPRTRNDANWCTIRQTIFSWTSTTFPLAATRGRPLDLLRRPIIRVRGPAFYDGWHAAETTSNSRAGEPQTAVWEIHPVEDLEVIK